MFLLFLATAVSAPVLTAALLALVRALLVVVTVKGESMSPTLLDGDRVLVSRRWPTGWLRRGSIALVCPPGVPAHGRGPFGEVPYIKRVIALPGDTVVTSLAELDDPYQAYVGVTHDDSGNRAWDIPFGRCFVRGDNRRGSADSISWGPIPLRNILGIVIMKLPRAPRVDPVLTSATDRDTATEGPVIGLPAPYFTAETLEGERVTPATYAGRAVAFIFASPGLLLSEALPEYEAVYPRAARSGVDLVLVSIAGAPETRAFVDERGTDLPVIVAPRDTNPFFQDYSFEAWPMYCLIDAQGVIRSAGYPGLQWGDWKALAESWSRTPPIG
jgi:signal peptidase I